MEIVEYDSRRFLSHVNVYFCKTKKVLQPNHYINCLNSLYIVLACTVQPKIWISFFLNHYQNVVFIEKLQKIYKKILFWFKKNFHEMATADS